MNDNALERYRKTLAESVVFAQLSPAELEVIMASCRLIDVRPGEALLSEGKKGGGLYVILEGEVEFFLPERSVAGVRRPSRVRLNMLGPGRWRRSRCRATDRCSARSMGSPPAR